MALWTPTELGSLVSRWKSSAITGLSDGDAVGTWADPISSYNGTASGGARPTYKTGILNTLPIVRFSGSNVLSLGSTDLFRNVSGGTIFALKKDTATTTRSDIIHIGRGTGDATRALLESGGSGGSSKHEAGGRRQDADSYARALGSTNVDDAWRLLMGVFDFANTDLYLYLDGVQDASNTSFQSAGSTSDTASFSAFLGASLGTPANAFTGDLAEVLVFHAALSTDERQKVEGYAAHAYGVTGNLAADHPYKSSAPTTGGSALLSILQQSNQFAGGVAL
jgi:hypothetical protein